MWCQSFHIPNGLHAPSRRNKRQLCGHIPKIFNCFPFIKLTGIADKEKCACFHNTPDIYRGGLLQPHSLTFPDGLGLLSYGAFSNAPQSPSVWACVRYALTLVPYGAFLRFVAHGVLVNASMINFRHHSHDGGVYRSRLQGDWLSTCLICNCFH